ncbi:hypothetical protein [Oxalobacter paraformigenes]|nr:hypothetical protein [Oxalobacter paraformigenes]
MSAKRFLSHRSGLLFVSEKSALNRSLEMRAIWVGLSRLSTFPVFKR